MKKALLFPGQGAQAIGMGNDLYNTFAEARSVFEEVDDALNFKLSDLIFNGTEEELTQTQNAQPALMAVSIAVWRVLQKQAGFSVNDFSFAAGHSLGQYSALCVAESISLWDTARLLRARGEAFSFACKKNAGKMVAIIGLDRQLAQKVADESKTFLANDNATGQIVISGKDSDIQRVCELAVSYGARKAIPLNVAGAFHSPLMQCAADKMQLVLENVNFKDALIPVISNLTAETVSKASDIKKDLILQITGQVEWTKTQHYLKQNGVGEAFELGAGKVLAGMMRRTEPDICVKSIGDTATLMAYMEERKRENV